MYLFCSSDFPHSIINHMNILFYSIHIKQPCILYLAVPEVYACVIPILFHLQLCFSCHTPCSLLIIKQAEAHSYIHSFLLLLTSIFFLQTDCILPSTILPESEYFKISLSISVSSVNSYEATHLIVLGLFFFFAIYV